MRLDFCPERPSCSTQFIFVPVRLPATIAVFTWQGQKVCELDYTVFGLEADDWCRRITPIHDGRFLMFIYKPSKRCHAINAYQISSIMEFMESSEPLATLAALNVGWVMATVNAKWRGYSICKSRTEVQFVLLYLKENFVLLRKVALVLHLNGLL